MLETGAERDRSAGVDIPQPVTATESYELVMLTVHPKKDFWRSVGKSHHLIISNGDERLFPLVMLFLNACWEISSNDHLGNLLEGLRCTTVGHHLPCLHAMASSPQTTPGHFTVRPSW